MIGSSFTKVSQRSSCGRAGVVSTASLSPLADRYFGNQNDRKYIRLLSNGRGKNKKKNALRRQRTQNPTITEPSSSSSVRADSSKVPSRSVFGTKPSALSGCRVVSDPISHPSGIFDENAGLSKLQLRPSLEDYLEKYHLDETSDNTSMKNGTPAWESSKLVVPPSFHTNLTSPGSGSSIPSDVLLRKSSTLATGQKHRNILNDQDDDGFVIDRDSMFDPSIHLPHAPKDWKGYEAATPLSDFLMQRIGVSGQPISTAEYMRHALTHPLYGYYTSKQELLGDECGNGDDDDDWDKDHYGIEEDTANQNTSDAGPSTIFGRGGDFVTAPELSSVFGHSLCVWFMTLWQQEPLGKPPSIQFVELGPGKGTLMADLLVLAHSSKLLDFGQSIKTVHLVEASQTLRREQQETLETALGHLVRLEFIHEDAGSGDDENITKTTPEKENEMNSLVNTIRVEWHDNFSSFQANRDKSLPTMVIMQEFLDALPVHQFQKTEEGWRERMIDVVSADETNEAGEPIPVMIPPKAGVGSNEKQLIPRLRQVLAPNVTPAVELLLSPNRNQYDHFPEGTVVEICPDALFLVQDVAKVLEESQGAALIIDYGEEGTTDTLRAFSRHQQVPLTSRPGRVDVTADVDFFALKNSLSVDALKKNKEKDDGSTVPSSINAFGPVPQGEFLMKMGAGELTMNAIEKDETTEEQAQAFADALKYLVMPEHMGTKFKVLALSRKRDGLFGPAGIE